jgi:SAM-dependent methyltransferase
VSRVSQTNTCRACAAATFAARHDAPDTMYGTGESFTYGECASCGSLTLLDPPDDFAPYYPPTYLSMTVDPAALGAGPKAAVTVMARSILRGRGTAGMVGRVVPVRRVQTMATILDSVARVPGARPRRVLDVGSGSGMVPLAVSLAGDVDVLGIDPFASGDRGLGEHAELRAITLDEVTGAFDLVMLHHSLEHMLDPFAALHDVRRVLADGGVVLVRVPTASSHAWQEYRTDWIQLDPPRHVWIPSRPGMAALARRAGLEIVATYDDSNEFQFWGSEQARRGIPLMDPRSQFVDPRASVFSGRQMREFRRRSRDLNRALAGDQTVVYLRAAASPPG